MYLFVALASSHVLCASLLKTPVGCCVVLFDMYDIDNDGFISSHELQLLFKTAMGFVHHLHAVSHIFPLIALSHRWI
jgi:hypothetical protein